MDKKALYPLSYGLYVCGVKNGEGFGGCVIDAVAQTSAGEVPQIMYASMNGNFTRELIEKTGEFSVSVLPRGVDPLVIADFGYQSARDGVDKWAKVPHEIKDGLPYLAGALSYLRCKVTDTKKTETHTLFFADVTDAWTGERGTPLLYADYQNELKPSVSEAFKKMKAETDSDKLKSVRDEFREAVKAGFIRTITETAPKQYECPLCGYIYSGETPFEDLPDDWTCPLCGAPKSDFVLKK